MSLIAPGVCRHCGCTETDPCRLGDGDTCGWMDRNRLVCSNGKCVMAEIERKRAYESRVGDAQRALERERKQKVRAKMQTRKKGRAA